MGRPEVHRQDQAGITVESKKRGRAASGGGGVSNFDYQPGAHQGVDPLGDGGSSQTGHLAELSPGPGATRANQIGEGPPVSPIPTPTRPAVAHSFATMPETFVSCQEQKW